MKYATYNLIKGSNYEQVLQVCIKYRTETGQFWMAYPTVVVIMKSKKEASYKVVFERLKKMINDSKYRITVDKIVTDMEVILYNSI